MAQQTLLLLARDEREQATLDEDDEHEVVVAAAPLDPRVLVEDELLLTLPFAPHCERGDCTWRGPQTAGRGAADAGGAKARRSRRWRPSSRGGQKTEA